MSDAYLTITLPSGSSNQIYYQTNDKRTWRVEVPRPNENWSTKRVWEQIHNKLSSDRDIELQRIGAEIGNWLLQQEAAILLRSQVHSWKKGDAPLQIALVVPWELSDYPWEAAHIRGLSHLGILEEVTVYRLAFNESPPPPPILDDIQMEMVGVALDDNRYYCDIDTTKQIVSLRHTIENSRVNNINEHRLYIELDSEGIWNNLTHRIRYRGSPDVFYFTGHGSPRGNGLIFRGTDGLPEEISASRVAALLCGNNKEGRGSTQLVVLNTCFAGSDGEGIFQPFGGVAPLLVQNGVPMVIGVQTPWEEQEARLLGEELFPKIFQGCGVDIALQKARRHVYLNVTREVGWAFVHLTVKGHPQPLWEPRLEKRPRISPLAEKKFGHRKQRHKLELLLITKRPLVILIHGPARSGHRHVVDCAIHEILSVGRCLYLPIFDIDWFVYKEPQLSYQLLLGAIARALHLDEDGNLTQLKDRIIKTLRKIAAICEAEDKVMVMDLKEPLLPKESEQVDAMVSFVTEIWSELVRKTMEHITPVRSFPIFVILSLATPVGGAYVREVSYWVDDAVEKLLEYQDNDEEVLWISVLPRLEEITEIEVVDFLRQSSYMNKNEAKKIARYRICGADNEQTLSNLHSFIQSEQEG